MNNDQIKVWYHLKTHQPDVFSQLLKKLPKAVIKAYDAQVKMTATQKDLLRIDQSIKIEPIENQPAIPNQLKPTIDFNTEGLLNQPIEVLAYFYFILPLKYVDQLDQHLGDDTKTKVHSCIEQLRPYRMSSSMVERLLVFMEKQYSSNHNKPSPNQKNRILETLASIHSKPNPNYLNPKSDLGLFSQKDQQLILTTFHKQKKLTLYLQSFEPKTRKLWLQSLSDRQKAVILSAVHSNSLDEHTERSLRNTLIQMIRQLQDENKVNPEIKS